MRKDAHERRLIGGAAAAAREFLAAQPWTLANESETIAFVLPGEGEPWFGAVFGHDHLDHGLHLARGAAGLTLLRVMADDDADAAAWLQAARAAEQLEFRLAPADELSTADRQRLERAGVSLQRGAVAPFFSWVKRGRRHFPDARGLRRLRVAAGGMVAAIESGALTTEPRSSDGRLRTLEISGSPSRPRVDVSRRDFAGPPQSSDARETPPPVAIGAAPLGDLATWRAAEARLIDRAMTITDARRVPDRRSDRIYFGPAGLPIEHGSRLREATPAYLDWTVRHYRRYRSEPTAAQRLLEEELPVHERALLEQWLCTSPSPVRITGVDPATGQLECVDLFDGTVTQFVDFSFSKSVPVDTSVWLTFVDVGGVIMTYLGSTGFSPVEMTQALAHLDGQGLPLTRDGVRRSPHLLGRLWHWKIERDQGGGLPTLVNNDGDLLEPCELVFSTDNPEGLRRRFAAEGFEYDDDDDTFTWMRPFDAARDPLAFENGVVIAHFRVIGEEVLVDANSNERAELVRAWMEGVPGTRFIKMTVSAWDAPRDVPLDDRLPADDDDLEVPPELVEHLRETLRREYTRWLDAPIPALSGQSPREAAATSEGRQRVALLVRTIPAPMPGMDVDALQRALLDELGIA